MTGLILLIIGLALDAVDPFFGAQAAVADLLEIIGIVLLLLEVLFLVVGFGALARFTRGWIR